MAKEWNVWTYKPWWGAEKLTWKHSECRILFFFLRRADETKQTLQSSVFWFERFFRCRRRKWSTRVFLTNHLCHHNNTAEWQWRKKPTVCSSFYNRGHSERLSEHEYNNPLINHGLWILEALVLFTSVLFSSLFITTQSSYLWPALPRPGQ